MEASPSLEMSPGLQECRSLLQEQPQQAHPGAKGHLLRRRGLALALLPTALLGCLCLASQRQGGLLFWHGDGLADDFELFGKHVSPFEALKGSFKPPVLKVDGAFTGGTCNLEGNSSACPLAKMPMGNLTGVFPGGETRCILGDTPYLFMVIPGKTDKLLLYFQGGGACWNEKVVSANLCTRAVSDEGRVGIFDTENPANPYRDYTMVIIGYCSGDAHVGHSDHEDWSVITSLSSKGVKQRGYINAKSAIDWTKQNVGDLDSLIITGSSAGALGTQVWSEPLLNMFSYKHAAVIADSYAAIFPFAVQPRMIRDFGVCDTGLLDPGLAFQCKTGTIDVQQIFEHAMRFKPRVAFASLDSKIDFVQIAFYKVVYKSMKGGKDSVGPQDFSQMLNTIYSRYNAYANWVSFAVNDVHHMYLNNKVMYQTTPVGNQVKSRSGLAQKFLEAFADMTISGDDMPLQDWLAEFPVRDGKQAETHCAGVRHKPSVPSPITPPSGAGLLTGAVTTLSAFASRVKTGVSSAFKPAVRDAAHKLGFDVLCVPLVGEKVFRG